MVSTIVLYTCVSFAETVYLKNGKAINGRILETTDKYVRIEFEGVPLTYYFNEIEKIEGLNAALVPMAPSASGKLYRDKEYGFELRAPRGWHISKIAPGTEGTKLGGVKFTKNPADEANPFPIIGITVDAVGTSPYNTGINSALDFARKIFEGQRRMAASKGGKFQAIEEPREIEIGGQRAARFITKLISSSGKAMCVAAYKFKQADIIISVAGVDVPDTFQGSLRDFEETANSFKFTGPAGN